MSPDEPQTPPLEDDRVAMMLGLVPDKRTPDERLLDVIRTNGESARYRYCGAVSPEGHVCDRVDEHETHTRRMDCGCTTTWVSPRGLVVGGIEQAPDYRQGKS